MIRMLVLAMLLIPGIACADVYRWVDDNGVVHYSDQPNVAGSQPVELPDLQFTPPPPEIGQVPSLGQTGPDKAKPSIFMQLVSPKPQATIRQGIGEVPIKVELSRPLASGEYLTYYLDGKPMVKKSRQTSVTLHDIERGAHQLSVALKRDGKRIASTDAVTVYVKRPSVNAPTDTASSSGTAIEGAPAVNSAAGAPPAPR